MGKNQNNLVKKPLFYVIFSLILFLFCSGCSKKLKNCDIFPNFKEIDYKDSKTRERIGKFLKDGEMYAHFKCNF